MISNLDMPDSPSIPNNSPDRSMAVKLARQAVKISGQNSYPIKIKDIVLGLTRLGHKITVNGVPLSEGFSGQIIQISDKTGILYNQNDSEHRQRFTVAHELGHFMMNHSMGVSREEIINLKNKLKIEKEANIFAAELLMPKQLIIDTQKNNKYKPQELANIFNVSELALWFKIESDNLIKYF